MKLNGLLADANVADLPAIAIPESLALPVAGAVGRLVVVTGVVVARAIITGAIVIRARRDRAADNGAADNSGRDTRHPSVPSVCGRCRRGGQRGEGGKCHQ